MYQPVLGAAGVVLTGLALFAAQQTLPELARQQGGYASSSIFLHYPILHVQELMSVADLVLQAKVKGQSTILGGDQMNVYTIYELDPVRVIQARQSPASRRPGQPVIRARRPGGVLMMDGLRLETDVDVFPKDAALSTGAQAVFFLRADPGTDEFYNVVGGPFGIFRVGELGVSSLTKEVATRRREKAIPLPEFMKALTSGPR